MGSEMCIRDRGRRPAAGESSRRICEGGLPDAEAAPPRAALRRDARDAVRAAAEAGDAAGTLRLRFGTDADADDAATSYGAGVAARRARVQGRVRRCRRAAGPGLTSGLTDAHIVVHIP